MVHVLHTHCVDTTGMITAKVTNFSPPIILFAVPKKKDTISFDNDVDDNESFNFAMSCTMSAADQFCFTFILAIHVELAKE